MNFKQLEYLITIKREGGLHRAAAKLFISQPALSQQLQRIEDELGIQIFDRSTSPLRPTYEGQHYLEVAEQILYAHKQAQIWISETTHCLHSKISIGISPSRSIQFLPFILPEFHKKYPGIQIELHEDHMFSLQSLALKGEIDLALMVAELFCEGMTFIPLLRERFYLAVPPHSKADALCQTQLHSHGRIDLNAFVNELFVLLHHGGNLRKRVDQYFSRQKITPKILLETTNMDLAYTLCHAGYGLTFVPEMCIASSHIQPGPNCYLLHEPEFQSWPLGISYLPNHYQTKAMTAFINFVKDRFSNGTPPYSPTTR